MNEKLEWANCPACGEEVTQLRPCQYFDFDGEKPVFKTQSVCIECAETPRSMKWVVQNWPKAYDNWPDPRIEEGWNPRVPAFLYWHRGEPDQEKIPQWRNRIVRVWVLNTTQGEPEYVITGRGGPKPLVINKTGDEKTYYCDNAMDAWATVKRLAKDWGNND